MTTKSKKSPLHAHSKLAHRSRRTLGFFGSAKAKCIVAGSLDGDPATIVDDAELFGTQFHSDREAVVVSIRTQPPRPVNGIVNKIKNGSRQRNVARQHV